MITNTKLIMETLTAETMTTDTAIIEDLINNDVQSCNKENMQDGVNYYETKNTEINERTSDYYQVTQANDGQGNQYTNYIKRNDEFRANNKIAASFLKIIIDQKANYIAGNPVVINNVDKITETYDVNDFLNKIIKESGKKGVEWVHPYIGKDGEFKAVNISGQEIIPVYDTEYLSELIGVIRYYLMTVIDSKGNELYRYRVEVWDNEKVTYYQQDTDKQDTYYCCNENDGIYQNPRYHWYNTTQIMGVKQEEQEPQGWGRVPFIPLYNNDEQATDLEPVKLMIDAFDKCLSDYQNNLDDIQELVTVIKGCMGGENEVARLQEMLKKSKMAVGPNEDFEIKTLEQNIPYQARLEMLKNLEDYIFLFGRGVNPNKVGEGNLTNVVIKARFASLDLKSNETMVQVRKFLKEFYWFVNEYNKMTGKGEEDLSKMEIVFNKSTIINNTEMIENVIKSKGVISDETAISNHPFIDNYELEKERMDQEQEERVNSMPEMVEKDQEISEEMEDEEE